MPKISIVIPIYNVQNYLRQALDSVINQTLTDIEIVCVEDCSTDNSRAIVQEYAQKDSRIKLILNEKNKGVAVTKNRGIDSATGDYIMFLDSDDWYEQNACEIAYNNIRKNQSDFMYFNMRIHFESTKKVLVQTERLRPFFNCNNPSNILLYQMDEPFMSYGEAVYKIYRRDFLNLNNIRFSLLPYCEDVNFYIKAICCAKNVSVISDPLYNYRRHAKSLTYNKSIQRSILDARKEGLEIVLNSEHCEDFIKWYCVACVRSLFFHYSKFSFIDLKEKVEFYKAMHAIFVKMNSIYDLENIEDFVKYEKLKTMLTEPNVFKYTFKRFMQKLFSIKEVYTQRKISKKIAIFGVEISINQKLFHLLFCRLNQYLTLNRVKKKCQKEKIKVVFLSNEISKWNATSLYWALEKSNMFEPLVLVFPLLRVHNLRDFSQPSLKEQYDFYKNQGMNVEYAYKNSAYIKLQDFKPDIVFYQQKWDIPVMYGVPFVSKFALPCYFSYGCQILDSKDDYSKDFNKLLFKYFVESDLNIKRYESYNKSNSANCVVTGLPKLDAYLENKPIVLEKYWKEPSKFKIIYAPHHSFENDGLNFATFKENGKFIQELAKRHPETTWIFKPHPRFKFALLKNNIMKENEIDEYYKTWEEIGNIYTSGDYLDIFKSSDLMITDCCSFLGEYLLSEKPLIRLLSPKAMKLNSFGEKLTSEYYISHNNKELEEFFDEVAVQKNDYKKIDRLRIADTLLDYKKSSGEKILNYLQKVIKGRDN